MMMGYLRLVNVSTAATALLVCLLFGALLLLPRPVLGFDWLKTGKDLLQDTTGQQADEVSSSGTLSNVELGAGLKEALKVGSERVVAQLGTLDGFNADPQIHIPLPDTFLKVRSVLDSVGQAGLLDDLELKLNRAAEQATPQAKQLFVDSIAEMSVADAQKIYNGPQDAATRYFQGKMSPPLAAAMQPLVADSLTQVGAVQAYDAVIGQYSSVPFVPDVKADLTSYVVDKGMDGIFFYLAKEEAAIRQDPVKRTTELLQQVFGAQGN